jgi:ubiquitin-activating enzyme E1 C
MISLLKAPSIRTPTKSLYMQAPKALEESTRPNLLKSLKELMEKENSLTVTDASLPISLQLTVSFT